MRLWIGSPSCSVRGALATRGRHRPFELRAIWRCWCGYVLNCVETTSVVASATDRLAPAFRLFCEWRGVIGCTPALVSLRCHDRVSIMPHRPIPDCVFSRSPDNGADLFVHQDLQMQHKMQYSSGVACAVVNARRESAHVIRGHLRPPYTAYPAFHVRYHTAHLLVARSHKVRHCRGSWRSDVCQYRFCSGA